MHVLSTRKTVVHSRACQRLWDFDVMKLQALDESAQLSMIERRIPREGISAFKEQLAVVGKMCPQMCESLLLSLMINSTGVQIPKRRVDLYKSKLVPS